ncbi:hypothetical protein NX801_04490 [Streptomyces sp. LP05-1]|uniref:Lipoprotein n=1 Tax=Streptomyces pyxinae TaxID=2970734 RepID=A0ABT2CBY9_9ACTN|nr:hypothetical protein [Streptomyces sp. LP05-1]MCS0634930.1 hypothetical protein [Streptomyces sp. LP05-1]
MSARRGVARAAVAVCCTGVLLTGCGGERPAPEPAGARKPAPTRPAASGHSGPGAASAPAAGAPRPAPLGALGPATLKRVPLGTSQALVVTGEGVNSPDSSAVLYERGAGRAWRAVAGPWPAHNALRGWTPDHRADDLRSPVGVFRLRDAGGRLPDPGTALPYDEDPEFADSGTGFLGESLEGSFDYVIAIDYNRVPGTSPLNKSRPLGEAAGGGIWVHVDHGGPTRACVSLAVEEMEKLLRRLDPGKEPVIVMGDAASLAR